MTQQITAVGNERMEAFISSIAAQITQSLQARSDDMLAAWNENMEEATANEKNLPPLKLSIGATVDLEKGTIETVLKFTVTYQESLCEKLPDPNQPDLPGVEDEMSRSIEATMREAGIDVKVAKRAARKA